VLEGVMKLAAALLSVVLAQGSAIAPQPSSAFLGRWGVDVATISLPPEQRPKSVTMTFSDAGHGQWRTSVDIVSPDGTPVHSVSTYVPDGTPAAVAPDGEYDHVAITTPAPNVLVMALSKAGTPGTTRIYTLSPDGNTDIETHVYQTPQGPLSMKTAVWRRLP
jgi:hypothetical protein